MKQNLKHIAKPMTAISLACLLAACGGEYKYENNSTYQPTQPVDPTPPATAAPIPAFDNDGVLSANIRWTDYGVPHVTADNLQSLSYGVGYAFAKDNICVLADQILKYNSQRSKYYGPDMSPGSGDSEHLINDFGYLALEIRSQAEKNLKLMSINSQALLSGYAQGYNKYLADTGVENIDAACAGQPWVQPISDVDMLTYSLGVALLPGASNFLGPMFLAAPMGESFMPYPVAGNSSAPMKILPKVTMPEKNPSDMGSNGWGLGKDKTENGKGMVLANPHFPHTGNLRFWQFHSTIPGHLNVMGGSLMGMPGVVNIGFNENIAWTHTFSTAEHFVVYQLTLDNSLPGLLNQTVDGAPRPIEVEELVIDVAVAPGVTIKLAKKSYSTLQGPMIVVPGSFEWTNTNAFAIKDANKENLDILDHWLAMNVAGDINEFKQAFKDYDGVIFNNTMSADKEGNVFYIDDSTVPNLSDSAIATLTTNPTLIGIKKAAGFTVLPGNISAFIFDDAVPYDKAPKYMGTDYVQNSNDSFWLTNAEMPIVGVSPLYGNVGNQQSLRSRMAHTLLGDAAGSDNLFSLAEVEQALVGNRSYLSEAVLNDLLTICNAQGSTPVNGIDISEGCSALALWDGTMNKGSVAAHLFREFAFQFNRDPQWITPFDANNPLNTPSGLVNNSTTLAQFAQAINKIKTAGIALDARLDEVQFVERSKADGSASGEKIAWAGAHNIEGGFNVFTSRTGNDGTLLPRHVYPAQDGTSILSAAAQGYHIGYGSSWMSVVNFTDDGPVAKGLLSYSQSHAYGSEHNTDQSELYSAQPQLRPLLFKEADIEANKIAEMTISSQ
ncbi:acyl-homoserine-lactone acylase [Thalassotalea piscium]|uniref:Acyl-homoserine-lactone acylase n=2 Tax=Thalassotalea piscium TaxID=1230533 RepID=A0A7X0TSD4_9GAMM|nr:acyl-homoserine-lactone acylase [Thalassotalea piscium]